MAAPGDRVGPLPPAARRRREGRACSARLSQVEGMEHYLRRAFLGQKQFSIEGLDVMVPMLDEAIEVAADDGAHEVVIGMAHRGRLNVLAHVVGRPYEVILREFEGERTIEAVVVERGGRQRRREVPPRRRRGPARRAAGEITVTLASNPSHLEAVDPVVEGRARAEQTDRSTREGYHDPTVALPILIHGDASFAGQGEVAETLNLAGARGLLDRRHAAPDREQPGRLHDRPERRTLDALLERPREGLRHPDHPRERRRPRGCALGGLARAGVPPPVRARRRRRPRRLPAPRSQRAGRGRVHAAAARRGDRRRIRPCASSTRQAARRDGVLDRGAGRRARAGRARRRSRPRTRR